MLCPQIKTSELKVKKGTITVVRDDFLPGGTKQRGGIPFLSYLKNLGIKEFVYASPFSGFAQIALSICSNKIGVKSKIFAEIDHKTNEMSSFTKIASNHSQIQLCKNLNEAEEKSLDYCSNKHIAKIPLGFNHPMFVDFLKEDLTKQLSSFKDMKTIWLPVGSGTLVKTFRDILPEYVQINCVDVKVLPENDERIQMVKNLKNINYMQTLEDFQSPCINEPPIPSNLFYDSKLWTHINSLAEDGDVWWNVAC